MKKRPSLSPRSSLMPKSQNTSVLDDIHKKIVGSPALNGGFDTLLYKIDKIEQSQGQLVTKVDKIHEAIYDPNEGIFAKLSEQKLDNTQKFGDVQQDIASIKQWKDFKEKSDTENISEADANSNKIVSLERSVDSLTRSKDHAWSILKWLGVAIGGGIITLIFKFFEAKLK